MTDFTHVLYQPSPILLGQRSLPAGLFAHHKLFGIIYPGKGFVDGTRIASGVGLANIPGGEKADFSASFDGVDFGSWHVFSFKGYGSCSCGSV